MDSNEINRQAFFQARFRQSMIEEFDEDHSQSIRVRG